MMARPAALPPGQKRPLHQDAQALRDYITAGDRVRYDLLPEGVVSVGVTHSNLQFSMADIRFDLHTRVRPTAATLSPLTSFGPDGCLSHQSLGRSRA
jgi:hypothetical protein